MKNWFCAIMLTLSVGCATATVRPYIGEQQAWPTASGSIVNTKYETPIFTSLPPSPYTVVGELRIQSPFYAQPEEGHMPLLVKKAKQLGADAILFVQGEIYFSTNYGPKPVDAAAGGAAAPTLTQVNRFNPDSFKPGVTILAIKWTGEPPLGIPKKAEPPPAAEEQPPATEPPDAEAPTSPTPHAPPEAAPAEPTVPEQPAPPPPPTETKPAQPPAAPQTPPTESKPAEPPAPPATD
jgi:hypothetical protein